MVDVEVAGRTVKLGGEGTPETPYLVKGTGYNPALAAEVENFVVGRMFEGHPWEISKTRVEVGDLGQQLAVVTVRFFLAENDLVQTEVWFDVTEALTKS